MRQTDLCLPLCTRVHPQFTDGLLALAADEKSGIECPDGDEDEGVAATLRLVVEKLL